MYDYGYNPQYNPSQVYQDRLAQLQSQRTQGQYPPFSEVQYVNGRQSAEQCPIPPNKEAIWLDMNLDRFYVKRADATGMATTESFDFAPTVEEEPTKQQNFVTREEFEELKAMVKPNEQPIPTKRAAKSATKSEEPNTEPA